MLTPVEFLKTVYLGDRACKRIIIDGWRKLLAIEIDRISRIRSSSGQWDFYTVEDITDGAIVFDGLRKFSFQPPPLIPCDWIDIVAIEMVHDTEGQTPYFNAIVSLGAVDHNGNSSEVTLNISATGIYLDDPKRPGVKITD